MIVRADEDALTREIIALASEYGRYGYRRITKLLNDIGLDVGTDRVQVPRPLSANRRYRSDDLKYKRSRQLTASLFRIRVIATNLNWVEMLANVLLFISVLFANRTRTTPKLDAQEFYTVPSGLA